MRCAAIIAGLAAAGSAHAQLIPSARVTPLRRVEPGVSDVGPMSPAGRVSPVDMRTDQDFENVYRFEQKDQFGQVHTYYARRSGGLTAVFPRSQYMSTDAGLFAQIPPGTVYMIGGLEPAPRARGPAAYNALDMSLDANRPSPDREPATPRAYAWPERSIWEDESYRRQRIDRLLHRAAGAR